MTTCPHCGEEYNSGAAICYHCNRYVSRRAWLKMNWQGLILFVAILLLSMLITGLIEDLL